MADIRPRVTIAKEVAIEEAILDVDEGLDAN